MIVHKIFKSILIITLLITGTTVYAQDTFNNNAADVLTCSAGLTTTECGLAGGTYKIVPELGEGAGYCECSSISPSPATTLNNIRIGTGGAWNWASGFKFKTDISWEPYTTFKGVTITPGYVGPPSVQNYVDIKSGFSVHQKNWGTIQACGSRTTCPPELDDGSNNEEENEEDTGEETSPNFECTGSRCTATIPEDNEDGDNDVCFPTVDPDCDPDPNAESSWCTGTRTATYTCKSDIEVQLNDSIAINQLIGGDTMYGTIGMLMSFLPPTFEDDCSKSGTCFVGNAYVVDTKAQFDKDLGKVSAFGKKVLQEGPGDVYYFDQVRALATFPDYIDPTTPMYNEPYLVGDWEFCIREISFDNTYGGLCNVEGTPFEAMKPVLEAAAVKHGISPALLAAVLYNEGATSRDYWEWTPENVMKWSTEGNMPKCSDSLDAAQGPYQFLKNAFEAVNNASGCSNSASRCNFIDASFAAAKTLATNATDYREKIKRYYCGFDENYCNTQTAEDYADQGMIIYNKYRCE